MSKQGECICCGKEWEWDCSAVFNFSVSMGKRVWPAVCTECRAQIETKYKCGELTHTELLLEFSSLSARAAKLCAGKVRIDVVHTNSPAFRPKRRGKH